MKRILGLAFVILAYSSFTPDSVRASLVLSISSPDDLSNLAVGSTATFDIDVTGTAADAPGYLSASIQYDPALFSSPVVTPGAIVPALGYFDSTGTGGGTVTAFYDDSIYGTAAIGSDGLFYSFTLTRIAGSATAFSFSAFSAMNDSGYSISIEADPDSIEIGAAPGTAVPEPSSLVLILLGMILPACSRLAKIRARRGIVLILRALA